MKTYVSNGLSTKISSKKYIRRCMNSNSIGNVYFLTKLLVNIFYTNIFELILWESMRDSILSTICSFEKNKVVNVTTNKFAMTTISIQLVAKSF